MKKLLLTLFIISGTCCCGIGPFAHPLRAQTLPPAPPLVDTLNEWWQITGFRIPMDGNDGTHRFRFSRDTVMRAGRTYRRLELSGDQFGDDDSFRDWWQEVLMRQEGGIVYQYARGNDPLFSEIVAYDFTLELGDTIQLNRVNERLPSDNNCRHEVTRVDTIQLETGEQRRRLTLTGIGGQANGFTYEWIDGIGGVRSLGENSIVGCLADAFNNALLRCHYRAGELLYAKPDTDRFQGCWQDSLVSTQYIDPLPELTLFPNPATTRLTLSGVTPTTSQLFTLTGRAVARFGPVNELPLNGLPPGLYLLRITTTDGRTGVRRVVIR